MTPSGVMTEPELALPDREGRRRGRQRFYWDSNKPLACRSEPVLPTYSSVAVACNG